MTPNTDNRPGSAGEHELQERYGTFKRAAAFYDKQMLDHLNPLMREYLARQEMVFIATSDANGECDASFRAGRPGFVRVLDDRTVMYPEYRGNGVMASLGNMSENPHIGMVFADFFHSGVGLHINGRATIVEHHAVEAFAPVLARMAGVGQLHDEVADKKKTPERWVLVDIVEAYIHCSKHIPILAQLPGNAGQAPGSGDYFKAKDEPRPWSAEESPAPAEPTPTPAERAPAPAEPTPTPAERAPTPAEPTPTPAETTPTFTEPIPTLDQPVPVGSEIPVPVAIRAAAEGEAAPVEPAPLQELGTLLPPAWNTPAPTRTGEAAPRNTHGAPPRRARRPWSRALTSR